MYCIRFPHMSWMGLPRVDISQSSTALTSDVSSSYIMLSILWEKSSLINFCDWKMFAKIHCYYNHYITVNSFSDCIFCDSFTKLHKKFTPKKFPAYSSWELHPPSKQNLFPQDWACPNGNGLRCENQRKIYAENESSLAFTHLPHSNAQFTHYTTLTALTDVPHSSHSPLSLKHRPRTALADAPPSLPHRPRWRTALANAPPSPLSVASTHRKSPWMTDSLSLFGRFSCRYLMRKSNAGISLVFVFSYCFHHLVIYMSM